jgi:regulatory protein
MDGAITALTVQKRNRQRVNVYLDGEFAFGLSRLAAAWLRVGQVLTAERVAELQAEDAREVAYQQALKYAGYRPRSSAEVRRYLEAHTAPPEAIDGILERLQELGMLNDARFAQAWVEDRSAFRPRSRKALSLELRRRGLEGAAAEQALAAVDDAALAYQAAQKQARKLRGLEWPEFRLKLIGFLARRGFSYEVAAPVVRQVWDEQHTSENEESL